MNDIQKSISLHHSLTDEELSLFEIKNIAISFMNYDNTSNYPVQAFFRILKEDDSVFKLSSTEFVSYIINKRRKMKIEKIYSK